MPLDKHRNSPNAIETARRLRRDMTWPEKKFWNRIKTSQFLNLKFRKQHPIGPFVVDFYCASIRLVVEIDGDSHVDAQADTDRQRYLERLDLMVIRYTNDEVLQELDWVMDDLENRLRASAKTVPPLAPPFEGGE